MVSLVVGLGWLVMALAEVSVSPITGGTEATSDLRSDQRLSAQSAWLEESTNHGEVHMDWLVDRDSRRDGNFGFQKIDSPATGQLWLGGQQARTDQTCLVVQGRDGLLHPQDRRTQANRQDFRHFLFYQHLAGSNPLIQSKQVSLSMTPSLPLPSNHWGGLIQFASLAPVLAAAPHFALSVGDIEVSERTAHMAGRQLPILLMTTPQSDVWELWVDPQADYRIVRWLKREHGRAVGQIDIRYEVHSPWLPVSWIVTEFDPAGYVIDFLSAKVTNVDYTPDAPAELLTEAPIEGGLNDGRFSSAQQAYPLAASALRLIDLPLFPWIGLFLAAFLAASWKYRFVRWTLVCLLVMTASTTWLRQLPIMEPSMRPIYNELSNIWEQARQEIAQRDSEQHPASAWSTEQRQRLESLSQMLKRSYRLRLRGSLWATFVGRDQADEKARMELLQLAQHDLPSLLANDHNSSVRLSLTAERFQRIDQHLASPGPSSLYIPQINIAYRIGDPRLESP